MQLLLCLHSMLACITSGPGVHWCAAWQTLFKYVTTQKRGAFHSISKRVPTRLQPQVRVRESRIGWSLLHYLYRECESDAVDMSPAMLCSVAWTLQSNLTQVQRMKTRLLVSV